jgi:hypothetical protein
VVDDLSDALLSVNDTSGLPVFEVFGDDRIVAGQYGSNDFVIVNNNIGLGTNVPVNKLDVVGNISASVITASSIISDLTGSVLVFASSPIRFHESTNDYAWDVYTASDDGYLSFDISLMIMRILKIL